MAVLLSGLPETVPALTVNRLCASGLEAVGQAARAIASGDAELVIAGGVESMSRAPFIINKAQAAFGREQKLEDSTLGWRCINPLMQARYGVDSMTQTADNLAAEMVSRALPGCLCLSQPTTHSTRAVERLVGRGNNASERAKR
jgi:acetyl-CoA acetyltransferase